MNHIVELSPLHAKSWLLVYASSPVNISFYDCRFDLPAAKTRIEKALARHGKLFYLLDTQEFTSVTGASIARKNLKAQPGGKTWTYYLKLAKEIFAEQPTNLAGINASDS